MSFTYYDGTIDLIEIDCIPNCLIDNASGEKLDTRVARIQRPWEELDSYNEDSYWFVDWSSFPDDVEIYGIYVENDDRIQGLIALYFDENWNSSYVAWQCSAPWNRDPKVDGSTGEQTYGGVGAHLFAAARYYSYAMGGNGGIAGCANNSTTLNYYVNTFGAIPRMNPEHNNPYYFIIPAPQSDAYFEDLRFSWED